MFLVVPIMRGEDVLAASCNLQIASPAGAFHHGSYDELRPHFSTTG
jgi:hypothetical protein